MFSGLARYGWLAAALAIAIPLKVGLMKWWGRRRRKQEKGRCGRWGDDK